jgi:hypothetical protein
MTDVEFIVRELGFDSPSLTNCAQDLRNGGIHAFCHPPLRRHAAVPLSFRRQVSRCPEGHLALNLPSFLEVFHMYRHGARDVSMTHLSFWSV